MPNAVTHVLIAIIIVDLVRDYLVKGKKKNFTLYYVLIAGIAGLLPDIDYLFYYFSKSNIHALYTHNLFIPVIILAFSFIFLIANKGKIKNLNFLDKRNRIAFVLLLIAAGFFIHLLLDFIAYESISLMPLSMTYGLSLIPNTAFGIAIINGIDAILLLVWLWHEERKHKIRDFI